MSTLLTHDHRRKVFISYHHKNDQWAKDALVEFNEKNRIFIDKSVDTGGIDDSIPDETIRRKIRDEYLRDSTLTIILVGTETQYRKHIDWELYSSMIDGSVNKKSGIITIMLPSTNCESWFAAHAGEKEAVYPDWHSWRTLTTRVEYEQEYPCLPARIIDNLLVGAKISVTPWKRINIDSLHFLIEAAFQDRESCQYDFSRAMRRSNYNP
ncbi:MAG: TIR domain-containing protein [Desulfobulbus sp.]|nr:TIR domain-containing protein [Desulfobulbus sp.]